MHFRIWLGLIVLALAGTFGVSADAEPRIALVIGNAKYNSTSLPPLSNPVNDARLIVDALKKAGFVVIDVEDASQSEMLRAISALATKLKSAGPDATGFFYYAGAGVMVGGDTVLIPVDAKIENGRDAKSQGVSSDSIVDQIADGDGAMRIVMIDTGRNNPFGEGRSEFKTPPLGTVIAYSTAPGASASDGSGSNSPYAVAVAKEILVPGAEIREVLQGIRIDVLNATNRNQIPWDSALLEEPFYFVPAGQ